MMRPRRRLQQLQGQAACAQKHLRPTLSIGSILDAVQPPQIVPPVNLPTHLYFRPSEHRSQFLYA